MERLLFPFQRWIVTSLMLPEYLMVPISFLYEFIQWRGIRPFLSPLMDAFL